MKQPARACVMVVLVLIGSGLARATAPEATSKQTAPTDLGQLRDITGIEPLPPAPPRTTVPLWPWLVFALIAGSAPLVWVWLRRRRLESVPPPADLWALEELGRIERQGLPEAGRVELFYTSLSDVMRRYLELRFQLPAAQRTTPEFLTTLTESGLLSSSQQEALGGFLERCDLAKFARAGFSTEECGRAVAWARTFVEETAEKSSGGSGREPASVGERKRERG